MSCFLGGREYKSLLEELKATNHDYVTDSAVMTGELGLRLGFDFVVYNFLAGAGTSADPRKVLLMDSEAVAIATGPQKLKMSADERPDKSYKWQLYTALTMAAVRIEDTRVITIDCVDPV